MGGGCAWGEMLPLKKYAARHRVTYAYTDPGAFNPQSANPRSNYIVLTSTHTAHTYCSGRWGSAQVQESCQHCWAMPLRVRVRSQGQKPLLPRLGLTPESERPNHRLFVLHNRTAKFCSTPQKHHRPQEASSQTAARSGKSSWQMAL